MKTRSKAGLGAVAALALVLGTGVPSASAGGFNSVLGSNGTVVSLWVNGAGLNVSSLDAGVVYPATPFLTICSPTATATGTRSTGTAWSKSWGYFSGCVPASWASNTAVNLSFKNNSYMKLRVKHDGSVNHGKPQLKITA